MDSENSSLENDCENLMYEVVESRKRFGEMCDDYDKKSLDMEMKVLQTKIDLIKRKTKKPVPKPNTEDLELSKKIEEIMKKGSELAKRHENIRKKVKDIQVVVLQLKQDNKLAKRLKEGVSTDDIKARAKHNKEMIEVQDASTNVKHTEVKIEEQNANTNVKSSPHDEVKIEVQGANTNVLHDEVQGASTIVEHTEINIEE